MAATPPTSSTAGSSTRCSPGCTRTARSTLRLDPKRPDGDSASLVGVASPWVQLPCSRTPGAPHGCEMGSGRGGHHLRLVLELRQPGQPLGQVPVALAEQLHGGPIEGLRRPLTQRAPSPSRTTDTACSSSRWCESPAPARRPAVARLSRTAVHEASLPRSRKARALLEVDRGRAGTA